MRGKQLLGILLMALVLPTMAAAAGPQLTAVTISTQDNSTILTIRASAAFTHTEYRPSENLLLVDLPGVSAGELEGQAQTAQGPGVSAYRVESFQGSGGTDVARVEVTLNGAPFVTFNQDKDALEVRVTAAEAAAPAGSTAAAVPAGTEGPAFAAGQPATSQPASTGRAVDRVAAPLASQAVQRVRSAEKMSQPAWVRSVNVIHGTQGIEVEIRSNGVLKPTATKITHPDRVVVDLENARTLRPVQVAVNSDFVKGIRMALFQANPPVTRVVVDLEAPRDYELVPSENGLRVKLRAPSQVASLGAPPVAPAAAKAITVLPKAPAVGPQTSSQSSTSNFVTDLAAKNAASATTPANLATPPSPAGARDFVVVQPTNAPKAEGGQPAVRAAEAASKFSGSKTEIALSNTPALPASLSAASAVDAEQQAAAPPQAATGKPKYTGEPISVNLKDVDLKDFFRLIHEISGLNVVLDPNVHGTLTLVLDDVPWDQALDIVLKNNGLERELDANVLRIATVDTLKHEATSRREEVEAQALAANRITVTRFLSYAHSKDVVPTIKKFLSKRGEMVADERTNALIIMDIPQVFPEIDRLLTQLDRKTPEVEIEARVVAATRNFARDIGTQLGIGWTNGKSTAVGGASAVGTSPITSPNMFTATSTSTSTTGTTSTGIPLFSNLPAVGPTSGLSLLNFGSNY